MANPQIENGFTAIANELLEKMGAAKLNGTQYSILLIVLRLTYGYNRNSAEIAQSYLVQKTQLSDRQVRRELNKLIELNVIVVEREPSFNKPRVLAVNKDYETWNVTFDFNAGRTDSPTLDESPHTGQNRPHRVDESDHAPLDESVRAPLDESVHHKRKDINKTIKKDINKSACAQVIAYLNQQTGKNFKESTGLTKRLIKAREREGFTIDDFKTVIDIKSAEWKSDVKMFEYLRPETLFGSKFEGYLNQRPRDGTGGGKVYTEFNGFDDPDQYTDLSMDV